MVTVLDLGRVWMQVGKPDTTGAPARVNGSWPRYCIPDARQESGEAVSDRVTWEVCPGCGRTAAVGWIDEQPVEFDCTAGCHVSADQLRDVARRSRVRNWLARC